MGALFMRLIELTAYHGRNNPDGKFSDTHDGDNSHTLGAYKSTRYGTFFSDNPEFSALYGEVRKYEIDDYNIVAAVVLNDLASHAANELDYHDPDQRELALAIGYIAGSTNGDEWKLFDDDIGEYFVPWLIEQGYDGAQFVEYHEGPHGELRSLTTVVFDNRLIRPADINESFFSSNIDVLMPIVRGLMKTAARPIIYQLWKKSPNAVLALAAIKKLKVEGDSNPISTIDSLTDLDVPMQFIKRLAYDAGIFDIDGVRRVYKPPVGNNIN